MKKMICLLFLFLSLTGNASQKGQDPRKLTLLELEMQWKRHQTDAFYTINYILEKEPECKIAEKYAHEILRLAEEFKNDWNYGNAIYQGNMTLGYCSFKRGDIQTAKDFLNKAGETPGSPQLNSFGLNRFDMRLPAELLKKGEKQAVLEFLQKSKKYWKSEFSEKSLSKWELQIRKGEIPDFKQYAP